MPTPADNEVLMMNGWPKGANNRLRETESSAASANRFEIPSSPWLRRALNVDLTHQGHVLRRTGYTQKTAGFSHSLWSDPNFQYGYYVNNGYLTHIASNGTETSVHAVSSYLPVSYTELNGDVYWTNGEDLGRLRDVSNLHWGVDVAPVPVLSSIGAGGLFEGTYQVSVACSDIDSVEHGACEPVTITVASGQGIRVTFGTAPVNAYQYNVYCTQANAEAFSLVGSVSALSGSFDIAQSMLGRGRPLETLHRQPPRAGSIVRAYRGRIYIARRDMVMFTDPLRYHLTQPSQGIFMFDSDVTLLEPTIDGIYVGGAFGVVFVGGTDPYNVSQIAVSARAPVARASLRAPGKWLNAPVDEIPLWWGQDGVLYAGMANGELRAVTQDRLTMPTQKLGAMMLREREGMAHVVSVLRPAEDANVLGVTDSVVAEIRRGCVKLN
jgi:hypothetical protein